jgi:hypothetical protein
MMCMFWGLLQLVVCRSMNLVVVVVFVCDAIIFRVERKN